MANANKQQSKLILNMSPLTIAPVRQDSSVALTVPLVVMDDDFASDWEGVQLFTGGVVWEDTEYELFLELVTTKRITHATFCVNDHNDLLLDVTCSKEQSVGSTKRYHYIVETNASETDYLYVHPFSLTCGFSRVEITLNFEGKHTVELSTLDIVSLDEPRRGGPAGETAEEANVKSMFASLIAPENNQAAEWMFSPAGTSPSGAPLSSDMVTDWTHGSVSLRLQATSDALDLVFDGIEDTTDAFPTHVASGEAGVYGLHDTAENRAVRAMLASMRQSLSSVRNELETMLSQTKALRVQVEQILNMLGHHKKQLQSLPALVIIREHEEREQELLDETVDLIERTTALLGDFDDPQEGVGAVRRVPFELPEDEGVFQSDPTYDKLYDAMRLWDGCATMPLEREDVALHAIKPDRLFEYSALRRMLDWLSRNGFVENAAFEEPIRRFAYQLAKYRPWYENEKRCANTYHLVREAIPGVCERMAVDLYFQPVIHANAYEENGIRLHRVSSSYYPSTDRRAVWTPDYLLVIREDGKPVYQYLMDAKYCAPRTLQDKLRECVEKYLYSVSRLPNGSSEDGVDGVILLGGRLSRFSQGAAPDSSIDTWEEDGRLTAIMPANSHVGWRKMAQLFEILGIPALPEA